MSEEKEREKKEKKKRKSLLPYYPAIHSTLAATAETYRTLVQSSRMQEYLKTMRETWMTTKQQMAVLQSVAPYLREIQRMRELYAGVLSTPVRTSLMQVARESRRLSQLFAEMNRMVEINAPMTSITPIAKEIPSVAKSTVEGLARHIAFLEKDLAKEKAEKKELLKIINEMKKKLKKEYVV